MDKCGNCKKDYDGSAEFIICDGVCGKAFHTSCVGVPISDLKFFRKSKNYLWVCDFCVRAPAHTFFDTLALYKGDLDNLRGIILGLVDKVSANSDCLKKIQTYPSPNNSSSKEVFSDNLTASATSSDTNVNNAQLKRKRDNNAPRDNLKSSVGEPPRKRTPSLTTCAPSLENAIVDDVSTLPAPTSAASPLNLPSSTPAPTPLQSSSPTASVVNNLRIVPLPAKIFITRFSPDTTCNDIVGYINSRNVSTVHISCRKINKQAKPVASFLLSIPPELQVSLLDHSFWPTGTFAKIFEDTSHRPKLVHSNTNSRGNSNKKN